MQPYFQDGCDERRSVDAWRDLVEGFGRSCLWLGDYCRSVGVYQASFARWRKEFSGEAPSPVVGGDRFEDLGALGARPRFELRADGHPNFPDYL